MTEVSVSQSLQYLIDTDETCAQAKASMKYYDHHRKTVRALEYLNAKGDQKVREASAMTSQAYTYALNNYKHAVQEYETINNKRKSAELTIEIWRSQNANRRNGNV